MKTDMETDMETDMQTDMNPVWKPIQGDLLVNPLVTPPPSLSSAGRKVAQNLMEILVFGVGASSDLPSERPKLAQGGGGLD